MPIYGKLAFLDKTGAPKEKGINVGDEWTYRSFIEGRTSGRRSGPSTASARIIFPESKFPNGIPVEMTHRGLPHPQGQPGKRRGGDHLAGAIPRPARRSFCGTFLAKKFATDVQMIPRSFVTAGSDGKAETIDLFRDLVSDDGRLAIMLQCLEHGQYFGMAQADLYIRAADSCVRLELLSRATWASGCKWPWCISLGVMFSTFLSGPVALLATMFVIVAGLFSGYIVELAGGKMVGGGPFESMRSGS